MEQRGGEVLVVIHMKREGGRVFLGGREGMGGGGQGGMEREGQGEGGSERGFSRAMVTQHAHADRYGNADRCPAYDLREEACFHS